MIYKLNNGKETDSFAYWCGHTDCHYGEHYNEYEEGSALWAEYEQGWSDREVED